MLSFCPLFRVLNRFYKRSVKPCKRFLKIKQVKQAQKKLLSPTENTSHEVP